jgi:hypothetical protein
LVIRREHYHNSIWPILKEEARLVKTDRLAHGALDKKRSDILPVLLEQRHQEVDGQHSVLDNLILSHLDIANGNTQAENLLELELDGSLQLVHLFLQVVSVGDWGGELAGLVETRTQKTRNLLDEGFRSKESIVLLGWYRWMDDNDLDNTNEIHSSKKICIYPTS